MKTSKIAFLTLILFVAVSCQNQKAEQEVLYNQVMAVHDEVMPEMGSLMKLTKKLKVRLDTLMSNEAEGRKDQIIEINNLIKDLDSANESMMQWMRSFEPIKEGTPHAEVILFLIDEKKKIDKVKEDMLKAKENAEKYFLENQ